VPVAQSREDTSARPTNALSIAACAGSGRIEAQWREAW